MKKVKALSDEVVRIVAVLLMAVVAVGMYAFPFDKYSLDRDDLPEPAREFLTTYFPKAKVSMIKVDKHLLKKTDYDVKLVNGTKIEFNNKGNWTSVDCKKREVPEGIIIKPIRNYVAKKYSGRKIVSIVKKATAFEVGLDDGVRLMFDRLGIFKKVGSD